jgi:hypothetical protein
VKCMLSAWLRSIWALTTIEVRGVTLASQMRLIR